MSGTQVWDKAFNDTYINFTRDGLPSYNRISEISERILKLAEAGILSQGGKILIREGRINYLINTEQ